jgi:predicted  nucleic acid-binding Zn-ribbon protein
MSTLGKVLSILVALSLLGWIFLASLVADYHSNWTKRLADLKTEVAKVQGELPPLAAEIDKTKADINNLQVALERSRRNFRTDLARAQNAESETKETLLRFNIQLDMVKQEIAAAQAREAVRKQEVADLEKNIEKEKATVAEMMVQNKTSRDELFSLRKSFIDTLAENKSYVERLLKASPPAAAPKPRTRLGSLVR